MRNRAFLALPFVVVAALATPQSAPASAGVAALQVGLRAHGLYQGAIDGITGPATAKAIRRFQARARIQVDGVVGPQTRKALGRFARHRIGSRVLIRGKTRLGRRGAPVRARLARLPLRPLRRDLRAAQRRRAPQLPGVQGTGA